MLHCMGPALGQHRDRNECDLSRLHRQSGRYAANKIAELLARHGCRSKTARYFFWLVMVVNWKTGSVTDSNFIRDSPLVWAELSYTLRLKVAFQIAVDMLLNQYELHDACWRSLPKCLQSFCEEQFRSRKMGTDQAIPYERNLLPGGGEWKKLHLLLVFLHLSIQSTSCAASPWTND